MAVIESIPVISVVFVFLQPSTFPSIVIFSRVSCLLIMGTKYNSLSLVTGTSRESSVKATEIHKGQVSVEGFETSTQLNTNKNNKKHPRE